MLLHALQLLHALHLLQLLQLLMVALLRLLLQQTELDLQQLLLLLVQLGELLLVANKLCGEVLLLLHDGGGGRVTRWQWCSAEGKGGHRLVMQTRDDHNNRKPQRRDVK